MMILPITLTIAGVSALLNIWLGARCSRVRQAERISVGDGGSPLMLARMRAHANFTEYTPFVLILIGLIELADGTSLWLWIVAAAYILGRIAHAFGMDGRMRLRMIGVVVTMLVLMGLGFYAIAIPYLAQGRISQPQVVEGHGSLI